MSLIKVQPGEYYDENAMKDVMEYCHKKCDWWGGLGIRIDDISTAISDMIRVKRMCYKVNGKQLYHMEICISRATIGCVGEKYNIDKYNDDACCYLIAIEIAEILFNKGFQSAVFKHTKKYEDMHLHFVINSTNFITKAKLTNMVGISNELFHYLRRNYRFLRFDGPYFT